MKVLVIGVGLQGRAVVHDLDRSPVVSEVIAADLDAQAVAQTLQKLGCSRSRAAQVDVSQAQSLQQLVRSSGAKLVVCMVPPAFQVEVAQAAILAGAHFVSSSYTGGVAMLEAKARDRGLVLLPEIGFDPGIDLVLARAAVSELDEVIGLHMYGGGIPEAEAADNPLRYKISWTFEGVLGSYKRPARQLKQGKEVAIEGLKIFQPANTHRIEVTGLGALEAFPNGDAVKYAKLYELGPALQDIGRFALRWPGHCAFWSIAASLGFLSDEPIQVQGTGVVPRKFLSQLLEPQLQFKDTERDVTVLRVKAWGLRKGQNHQVTIDLIDRRDLSTGLYAMNRTVGYSSAIAAQMILRGEISTPGLLSPAKDIEPEAFFRELRARGMDVQRG